MSHHVNRFHAYRAAAGVRVWLLLAWVALGLPATVSAAVPLVVTLQRAAQPNTWNLTWPTEAGQRYVLQKSADLVGWINVHSEVATGGTMTFVDAALPQRTFWRVAQVGSGLDPVTVSPVVASYELGLAESLAALRVVTGGTQFVQRVLFLDQGVVLGEATAGVGGTWVFNLVWDGRAPQNRQLTARVITEEGLTVDTPSQAFLLADPSRFVPFGADGLPAYGDFVRTDLDGVLAAFRFYPEGSGGEATKVGAYFEFPPGARLIAGNNTGDIEFTSARFYRGHQDTTPLVFNGGARRISIDQCNPANVAAALGVPVSSLQVLWGNTLLPWLDGILGETGWASLRVLPALGDFPLPPGLECASVSFEPKTGEPTLILCFHGQWVPPSGPRLTIPRAEPLKFYLGLNGSVAAHGTVEALFPDGATVRGSVAWREPIFELRLEGRNIVIPAFHSLKRALPANAEQCLPGSGGNSISELDAATLCLTSYRDTFRGLAMGGLAEAPLNGTGALSPLAQPADTAGAALQAWAGRFASWSSDRAGQKLDAEMMADLDLVVRDAGRNGEAAQDLGSVLKYLRDLLVLAENREAALDLSAAGMAVRARLQDAERRLFAAADRILESTGGLEHSTELTTIVELLKRPEPSGGLGGGAVFFAPAQADDPGAPGSPGEVGPQLLGQTPDCLRRCRRARQSGIAGHDHSGAAQLFAGAGRDAGFVAGEWPGHECGGRSARHSAEGSCAPGSAEL
jgi:hypothetical protein